MSQWFINVPPEKKVWETKLTTLGITGSVANTTSHLKFNCNTTNNAERMYVFTAYDKTKTYVFHCNNLK